MNGLALVMVLGGHLEQACLPVLEEGYHLFGQNLLAPVREGLLLHPAWAWLLVLKILY